MFVPWTPWGSVQDGWLGELRCPMKMWAAASGLGADPGLRWVGPGAALPTLRAELHLQLLQLGWERGPEAVMPQ